MATGKQTRSGRTDAAGGKPPPRSGEEARQDTTEQRQDEALEDSRRHPSPEESRVRREQGGHDRPVGPDHKPHPRPRADPDE